MPEEELKLGMEHRKVVKHKVYTKALTNYRLLDVSQDNQPK